MADAFPWEALTPVDPAAPPASSQPEMPWADLTPVPQASGQTEDRLLPISPYDATDALAHGMTFGLSDVMHAALMAAGRYMRGDGFDYGQAARETQRGREAYEGQHPFLSAGANLAGGAVTAGPTGALAVGREVGPVMQTIRGALTGAGIGGVQGAADNSDTMSNALSGAGRGAAVGGLVGGAIPAAQGLVPQMTPQAQALRAVGIEPTPGNALGGLPGIVEDLAAKVPILGAPIQAGRQAAQQQLAMAADRQGEDFQRQAINRVLGHVGESLGPETELGNPAIQEMADKVGQAYQSAVPSAGGSFDAAARSDLTNAIGNAKLLLTPDRAQQFENFVNAKILGKVKDGVFPGEAFKDAESDLGAQIRNIYGGANTSDERALGSEYKQLRGTLRDWLQRVNPEAAPQITAANNAYREMLPVQDAAASDLNGNFNPLSLGAAARRGSGRVLFARGQAPMQDLAQSGADAQADLTAAGRSLRPGSGPGHAAGAGLSGTLIGADIMERMLEHPHGPALAAAALAYPTLGALYSNPGRAAINALLSRAGNGLNAVAPLSPFAAQYATQDRRAMPGSLAPVAPGF